MTSVGAGSFRVRTVLDAAGAADFYALAGMIEEAERLRIHADARSRESDSMEAALKEIVVRDRAELRHLMDERELPLRDLDCNTLLAKLERIGAYCLDLEEASLRKKLDAAIAKAGQLELELTNSTPSSARRGSDQRNKQRWSLASQRWERRRNRSSSAFRMNSGSWSVAETRRRPG